MPTQLATATITITDTADHYLITVAAQATGENLALIALGKPATGDNIRDIIEALFGPEAGNAASAIADSLAETFDDSHNSHFSARSLWINLLRLALARVGFERQ